jgi:hypothetical protein
MRSTASSKMTGKVRIMLATKRKMNQGTMSTKTNSRMIIRRRLAQANDPIKGRAAAN